MIRHCVMFKFAEGVDAGRIDAVAAGLDKLPAAIPEIHSYQHGPDAGLADGNFDYVVTGDFASEEDYVVYRDHPAHQEFIQSLIVGAVSERSAVQFRF